MYLTSGVTAIISAVSCPKGGASVGARRRVPVSPHPCRPWLLPDFLMVTILVGVKSYLIVVLTWIFLVTNDIKPHVMCSLAVRLSSVSPFYLGCLFLTAFFMCCGHKSRIRL